MDVSTIREHLMVHARGDGEMKGAPGSHVGTVDRLVEGRYIKLARKDSPDGNHHWLPVEWVEGADDKAVYLNKTRDEVLSGWMDADPAQVKH